MVAADSILPASWDLPAHLVGRVGESVGRQRAMSSEGHLLIVLHAPPKPEDDERVGRYFWRSPTGQWRSSDLGDGLESLFRHVDQYATIVEKFDELEEQAVSADDYFAILEGLAPIKRATQHLHQVLQDARDAAPQDRMLINARDRAYALERQAELLYTNAKNSLDFAVAKRSEELARSGHRMAIAAHRLNVLAAFFFPMATLATVLGVNLEHGWERHAPPWTFLGFVASGLLCGIVLTLLVMRPPRVK
jgi:hypothetical protein